jgi:hypothetical protein
MKGVVLAGDRRVEFVEFPDPAPGPGEVVLEIKASGMWAAISSSTGRPAAPRHLALR